jgi:hypothetical protein
MAEFNGMSGRRGGGLSTTFFAGAPGLWSLMICDAPVFNVKPAGGGALALRGTFSRFATGVVGSPSIARNGVSVAIEWKFESGIPTSNSYIFFLAGLEFLGERPHTHALFYDKHGNNT